MGRKKKSEKKQEQAEEASEFEWDDVLGSGAKRSIAAIFFVTAGLLLFVSFFNAAGVFGEVVDSGVGVAFGWGKWLFPILLFFFALFAFRKRETTLSDAVKFIGLGIGFLSFLGIIHLFLGDSPKEFLKAAKAGDGGGYLGYFLAAFFVEYTGKIAAAILLVAFFLAGVVAAFNVSLGHFLSRVFEQLASRWKKSDVEPGLSGDQDTSLVSLSEQSTTEELKDAAPPFVDEAPSEQDEMTHNIANIRFAEEASESEPTENVAALSFGDEPQERRDVARRREPERKRPRPAKQDWRFPSYEFLERNGAEQNPGDVEHNKHVIQNTLQQFGIFVEPDEVKVGPMVTQYAFRPKPGTKISNILSRADDLALALAAKSSLRIEAPIPGKALIGIEVPNVRSARVQIREGLESDELRRRPSNLTVVLGKDVSGKTIIADIESMPHLLIAGTTRSGKSVCIHSILMTLLYQNTPEDLKLILVDPKRVELSLYNGIPHLKSDDVIVENKKVVNALRYAVNEMERRLKIFQEASVRDISEYRMKRARGEMHSFTAPDGLVTEEPYEAMPYLVIIIDEMADLMITHGKEVEALVVRLAQKSRAAGIHLIFATQRPDASVVTGILKSNLPARIALKVRSQVDSRIVLDSSGADKLLGNGDMLFSSPTEGKLQRIQGVFVSTGEVKAVVQHWISEKRRLGGEDIGEDFSGGEDRNEEKTSEPLFDGGEDDFSRALEMDGVDDPKYEEAKKIVIESGKAATTYLQRRLHIGYGRAAGYLDQMEAEGIIGPAEGTNRGRQVLVDPSPEAAAQSGRTAYEDPIADQSARDKWQM